MDIAVVLNRLMEASVSVWLDAEGKLRIDKEAPAFLKDLVREHKEELIDVLRAQVLMNNAGIRIIRLPLGHFALAYRPGTDLVQIRWAMTVLRMDSMPLVINDEGLRWVTWDEWQLLRVLKGREKQDDGGQRRPPKVRFGRRTA